MDIAVVSIFPDMFDLITDFGVIGRAISQDKVRLHLVNPRDYTEDTYRRVDDRPYGGGPGMVMMAEPLARAIGHAKGLVGKDAKVVYLSPQGKPFTHSDSKALAELPAIIMIAGRYEGVDQRIIDSFVDEQWSIGDFVVSGGELPAMLIIDGLCRQLPDALGNEASAEQDSFAQGLLDCPHYTRPEDFEGQTVPPVLLSGHHENIERWRLKQQLGATWRQRPDLLEKRDLTQEESQLLEEFITEIESDTSSGDS